MCYFAKCEVLNEELLMAGMYQGHTIGHSHQIQCIQINKWKQSDRTRNHTCAEGLGIKKQIQNFPCITNDLFRFLLPYFRVFFGVYRQKNNTTIFRFKKKKKIVDSNI